MTAGSEYDVEAWVRGALDVAESAGGWSVLVRFYDSQGVFLASAAAASGPAGSVDLTWRRLLARMTAPPGATQARLVLWLDQAGGWIAFDDVALRPRDSHQNLVANPGFEQPDGWTENRFAHAPATSFWRGAWGSALPHGGAASYAISNHAHGYLESSAIAVQPGTSHQLSLWMRGEIDGADSLSGAFVRAVFYDGAGVVISSTDMAQRPAGSVPSAWTQATGTFTTPAGTSSLRLRLYLLQAGGWIAFDELSLTRSGHSQNLVPNPGFEVSGAWSERRLAHGPGSAFRRGGSGTATPQAGSFAYVIGNQADGMLESDPLAVAAGVDYDVAGWLRGALDPKSSDGAWRLSVTFRNAAQEPIATFAAAQGAAGSLDAAWRPVGGRVRAPAGAVEARVELAIESASGWLGWDDLSLQSVVDPRPRGAAFVAQTVPPTLVAGQRAAVAVTMRNVGSSTWTRADNYRLGSQAPENNLTWGLGRVLLEDGEAVAPGQFKTFRFEVVAPLSAGMHSFQWRLLQEQVAWFGTPTPLLDLEVQADTAAPPAPNKLRGKLGGQAEADGAVVRSEDAVLNLEWSPVQDPIPGSGLRGYQIVLERLSDGVFVLAPEVGPQSAFALNLAGLQHGESYRYSIRASDRAGNASPWRHGGTLRVDLVPPVEVTFTAPSVHTIRTGETYNMGALAAAGGTHGGFMLTLPMGATGLRVTDLDGPVAVELQRLPLEATSAPLHRAHVSFSYPAAAGLVARPDGLYDFEAHLAFDLLGTTHVFHVLGRAAPSSCVNTRDHSLPRYFQGKSVLPVYTDGAPAEVVNALNAAAGSSGSSSDKTWNSKCAGKASVPRIEIRSGPRSGNSQDAIRVRYLNTPPPAGNDVAVWGSLDLDGNGSVDASELNVLVVYGKNSQGQANPFGSKPEYARGVMAHELGHALGLGHDNCSSTSIMRPDIDVTSNLRITDEHCAVADQQNCDPAHPPAGGQCPAQSESYVLSAKVRDLPPNMSAQVQVEVTPQGSTSPLLTRNEVFDRDGDSRPFHDTNGNLVQVAPGWTYRVVQQSMPAGCQLVDTSAGTIADGGQVLWVRCGAYTLGGRVDNLAPGEQVDLTATVVDPATYSPTTITTTVSLPGPFTLPGAYPNGTVWYVETANLRGPGAPRSCTIPAGRDGTISGANVASITVDCFCPPPPPSSAQALATCGSSFSVGGTISGLEHGATVGIVGIFAAPLGQTGTFERRLDPRGNGSFAFDAIPDGWGFALIADDEPFDWQCFVFTPTIEVRGRDVNNARVTCVELTDGEAIRLRPVRPPGPLETCGDTFWNLCEEEACVTTCQDNFRCPDDLQGPCTDELTCVDRCYTSPVFVGFNLRTPYTAVTGVTPIGPAGGPLAVSGWRTDADGVGEPLLFYIDGRRAALRDYHSALASPEACAPLAALGQPCPPNLGFTVEVDAGTLAPGTHVLQVLSFDRHPRHTRPTLLEYPFVVGGNAGPTGLRVTLDGQNVGHDNQPPVDFGTHDAGTCQSHGQCALREFVVHNDRSAAVTLGAYSAPDGYELLSPPGSIAAWSWASLRLRFIGGDAGTFTGALSFDVLGDLPGPQRFRLNVSGQVTGQANRAPRASDDGALTNKNAAVNLDVIANDSDPDGDTPRLAAQPIVTPALYGTVARVSDRVLRYAPQAGFVGDDTFEYRVEDGRGGTDTGRVTVTVREIPPPAPTTVAASDNQFYHVLVTWTPPPGAQNYIVYRNTTNSASGRVLVGNSASYPPPFTTGSFIDYAVQGGVTYYYWVQASNAAGVGPLAGPDTGSAIAQGPPDLTLQAASATPTTLAPNGFFTSSVRVHELNAGRMPNASFWLKTYFSRDATLSADDAQVAMFLVSPPHSHPETVPHVGWVPVGAAAGAAYLLFAIDALNDVAESDENNNVAAVAVTITQPSPPGPVSNFLARIDGLPLDGLTVARRDPTVTFSWSPLSDPLDIERYQIVVQPVGGSWLHSPHIFHPATSFSLALAGLQPGVSYSVHIRALNGAGLWGPFVTGGVFTVALGAP